jgi:hypothetical protein
VVVRNNSKDITKWDRARAVSKVKVVPWHRALAKVRVVARDNSKDIHKTDDWRWAVHRHKVAMDRRKAIQDSSRLHSNNRAGEAKRNLGK